MQGQGDCFPNNDARYGRGKSYRQPVLYNRGCRKVYLVDDRTAAS